MNQMQALGLTLACELPVIALLGRSQPFMRLLVVATTASCLTHPIAWKVASILSADQYLAGIWTIEIGVVIFEAAWYQFWLKTNLTKSIWWSLVTNATSFGIGWVTYNILEIY